MTLCATLLIANDLGTIFYKTLIVPLDEAAITFALQHYTCALYMP